MPLQTYPPKFFELTEEQLQAFHDNFPVRLLRRSYANAVGWIKTQPHWPKKKSFYRYLLGWVKRDAAKFERTGKLPEIQYLPPPPPPEPTQPLNEEGIELRIKYLLEMNRKPDTPENRARAREQVKEERW